MFLFEESRYIALFIGGERGEKLNTKLPKSK